MLTAAQRRDLGTILALGGVNVDDTSQGRRRSGVLRRSTVAQLVRLGLVEVEQCPADADRYRPRRYFATAAGCLAFGAEVARA